MSSKLLPAHEWFETLPTAFVSTGALITDQAGRVLLVKANYRTYWSFPGGVMDPGEAPDETCVREVREEVGLDLPVQTLLVVDWSPVTAELPKPLAYFVFDCGAISADAELSLQADEIDDAAFFEPSAATKIMSNSGANRINAALVAKTTAKTCYLPMTNRL